jgi:hypothetical protein
MRQNVCSLAKADFASSSQHVREGQRIAALDDMLVETTPEPLAVALAFLLERRGRSQCECRDMAGLLLSWTNVRIRWKETCWR